MPTLPYNSNPQYNAHNANPFVGYVSSTNTIEVTRIRSELVCRQTRSASLWVVIIMLGSGFMVFGISQSPMAKALPHMGTMELPEQLLTIWIALILPLLPLGAMVFAVKKLISNGRIKIDPSGSLLFFSGPGDKPDQIVRRDEIDALNIDIVSFNGKSRTYTNYILVLKTKAQETIVLCASSEQALVEQFRQEIANAAGLETDDKKAG